MDGVPNELNMPVTEQGVNAAGMPAPRGDIQ
jgi:hypothetical protein